jgi:hypothetical protein
MMITEILVWIAMIGTSSGEPTPITIPISRKPCPEFSRLERAVHGAEYSEQRYRIHSIDSIQKRQLAEASLANIRNEFYSCPVILGNGQKLTLDLDTGSSDTWARGPNCVSFDGSCESNFTKIDIKDPTVLPLGKQFVSAYGTGSIDGDIYKTTVSVAGFTAHLPIGVTTYQAGFQSFDTTAGLLGLGFDSVSVISRIVGQNANYFDKLRLGDPFNQFGFYFSEDQESGEDKGQFTIGGYDRSKIGGPIFYVPLNSDRYWQFDIEYASYSIGSKTGWFGGTLKSAVCDTGTTLIIVPPAVADQVNEFIGAQPYDPKLRVYPIDCSLSKRGKDLKLFLHGLQFVIPSTGYVLRNTAGSCFSGISQGRNLPFILLGDVFLRQYYTIYDKSQKRIGFARARHY